jgi:hypothetical protein
MASPALTPRSISREQLVDALERLRANGSWSAEQAAALLDELDRGGAPPPRHSPGGRPTVPLGNRLAEAAAYAGAVLVGAAGTALVAQRWAELGRAGRGAVLVGVTLLLAAVGTIAVTIRPRGRAALLEAGQAVRRRFAGTALTIASVTATGAVAVLATDQRLVLAAVTAVVATAATTWVSPSAVSETAALGAVCLLAVALLSEAEPADESTTLTVMVLAFAAIGSGWAALSRSRALTVPTLGLALGLALVLYAGVTGTFADIQPATAVAVAVLGLLAAGGLALYVRTADWPAAVAAALALAALVLKVSSDTLSPLVAVFLTGLVLLGVGVVLILRRRTTDRR